MSGGKRSSEYERHIKSDKWQAIRSRILHRSDGVCEACSSALATDVHHLTYDRLGHELDPDLQALCPPCHVAADELRSKQAPARAYNKARNTYATKRYGDDFDRWPDPDALAEEFDEWLEGRDEL